MPGVWENSRDWYFFFATLLAFVGARFGTDIRDSRLEF